MYICRLELKCACANVRVLTEKGARSPEAERMLSLRDPGTVFIVCSCIVFLLPDYIQAVQNYRNADYGRTRQVTTPAVPPDDFLFLYQIDRDIRGYSYKDVNDILSYEDDTLPYALAEKLGQSHSTSERSIRVIKENLKKIKFFEG